MKKLTCISLLSLCLAACVPRSDQQPPSTQHYGFESPRTTTKTPAFIKQCHQVFHQLLFIVPLRKIAVYV